MNEDIYMRLPLLFICPYPHYLYVSTLIQISNITMYVTMYKRCLTLLGMSMVIE